MSLSQSSEINLTDNGKQALNAKALANSAHRVADDAHDLAYSAQKTADGKNRVFRGSDPNTIPTSELKEGDICFTYNSLYVWDGSTWVKMVSDTTQAEINAKVADAIAKAKSAEETADGKNRVFRVKDLNTISTSSLKTGDICFTDDTIYVWNGTTWEKTVSDITGAEIRAKVTEAIKKAESAEETAHSKNRVFRVKDPNTISNTGLKEGDICFTDNAVYTWTGGTWEKTVSDTTGAEIKARVDQATQESHKAVNELKTNIESKVKELDYDVESTRTNLTEVTNKIANDLSATKENLSAVKSDLSATKDDLENTKTSLTSSLDNAKKDIATTTSDLNSVKTSLADTRSSLATTANDLTSVKADLADTKNNLTTTTNDIKNGLSAVRNDLSATKENLENTKNSLSTTVANLQKQTGQLSGSLETANSKIKYNSNAIAEVKQTAEEISTTVSGMKVGGRNLVLGTQEAKTVFDGTGYTNMRDITLESGYYWPDLQRVVLKEHLSNLGLTYDDTLTVTGNLTISKNGTLAKSDFANDFAVGLFRTTHNWHVHAEISKRDLVDGQTTYKIKETFVIGDSEQLGWGSPGPYCWFNMVPPGYSISVDHYKVEKGNMATDWTPAPEDTDQAISKVSQKADAIRADLTNAKGDISSLQQTANGLTSRVGSAEGNISQLQQTADKLTSRMTNAEGSVSSLQQTAKSLTTRMSNAEGNVSNLKQTAQGLAADMKDAKGNISSLQDTASGLTSRMSNAEGDISSVQQTANSLNAYIKRSKGSSTLAALLSMDPNNSTIGQVVNGHIVAGINMSSEGSLKIVGDKLHITAGTTIDQAVIHAANIDSVDASTIRVGTLDASKVKVTNLDADNITTGTLAAEHLHVTKDTVIDNGIIGNAQIADLNADKIKAGTLDASHVQVTNLDANNIVTGTLAAERLHVTKDTVIDNGIIKDAMIANLNAGKITAGTLDASKIDVQNLTADKITSGTLDADKVNIINLNADKITSGTLDAAHVNVINLDANSITTGSLRAALYDVSTFTDYGVGPSSPWDFDLTKSSYGNWFLNGETTADHVYNGPRDPGGQKLTPYMYVTSRGSADGSRVTVTVWKDDDPTQYQRVWNGRSWSDWVMLPNSQNLVSAINLNPDSIKISGKNIELNGKTTVTGQLDLMQKNTNWINQGSNYHNPWSWNNAHIYFNNYLQLLGENCDVTYEDNSHLNGGQKFYSVGTLTPGYLKFTTYKNKVNSTDEKFDGQIARTYIDSSRIETNDAWLGDLRIVGHHIRAADDKFVLVSNHAGTNFDNNGSVGFQVYGGIGLGKATIYTPDLDLYIQRGNAVTALGQSYNNAGKVDVHCNRVISQVANTVSSRLSVKTDITPVSYDRALAAVMGTEMYDYRYTSDGESGQHYVSGIIDDVNPEDPQYHMDDMLINKERTARIDANLIGYHHVVLQELLKKIDELEIKLKSLENILESKEN